MVDDLAAATEFFAELGLERRARIAVEGRWVDRIVGLDGVRTQLAIMQTRKATDDSSFSDGGAGAHEGRSQITLLV